MGCARRQLYLGDVVTGASVNSAGLYFNPQFNNNRMHFYSRFLNFTPIRRLEVDIDSNHVLLHRILTGPPHFFLRFSIYQPESSLDSVVLINFLLGTIPIHG